MPIPDKIVPVLLDILSDGKGEHCIQEILEEIAKRSKLTGDEVKEKLPSGRQTRLYNYVLWTITHTSASGLIERTRRGCFKITAKGLAELRNNHDKLNLKYLKTISNKQDDKVKVDVDLPDVPPKEILDQSYAALNKELEHQILEQIKKADSEFLEQVALDLLQKMGYGAKILKNAAGKVTGGTGDGGIDGIIKEDALGFGIICYQTKRYDNNAVPSKEIRDFAGALEKHFASKGVFITTSTFSSDAMDFVKNIQKKIVLIDGKQLADLMVEHDIGVSVEEVYRIKKIDSDYFASDDGL